EMPPDQTDEFRRLERESPFRGRPVEENLDLFARMKAGEFPDGAKTLRARIDMQAPNVWLRDPVLYRIRHAEHHHTGNKWCIYPMYDWAHTLSDYIEGITHSLCTLEFEVHRPLYEWILRSLELPPPVLRPVKIVITNYPEDRTEELEAINNPEDPNAGSRKIPFDRELFIDAADFMEVPPPKYFRLKPGGEVRLKYAYIIKCDEVVKDAAGKVTELRCTVDLESKSGGPTAGRKVKGTIHWVSAAHAIDAEVRLYDRLFTSPEPDATGDFKAFINFHSLEVVNAKSEPALADARPEECYQFERLGYFTLDPDSTSQKQIW